MEPTTNYPIFYLNIDGQDGWSTHVGRGRTPLSGYTSLTINIQYI